MKTSIFKLLLSASLLMFSGLIYAQAPAGYYTGVEGKNKAALKTAFYQIIKSPSVSSYNGLWDAFKKTDKKPNGKVWDMYSDVPNGTPPYEFVFGNNQCGNYANEGDCYNREHSFPKSWFNDAKPMYSDVFHLYPTDGKVNGMRGNLPFGNVGVQDWKSRNGTLRGKSAMSGYSGTVFEPIDEYKGDFARSYFYMVTCYQDKLGGWSSPHVLSGTSASYPSFNDWSIKFLLEWSRMDPVSQKEIDRNNAAYGVQGNRNPFIDFPGLEEYIWGDKMEQGFDPDGKPAEPELVLNTTNLSFSVSELNVPTTKTINVKGANLTGSLSVVITGDVVFTAPVIITKPNAEQDGGYNLVVTYLPTAYGSNSATLQLYGGGITSEAFVSLTGTATNPNKPEITLSTNSVSFSTSVLGVATTQTVNVKGANLTGDLNILVSGDSEFTAPVKIAKADAEKAGGYDLTVTYLPTTYGSNSALLRLYGGGLPADGLVSLNGKATPSDSRVVLSSDNVNFSVTQLDVPTTKTVNIKGYNLTGNLSVIITGDDEFTAPFILIKPDLEAEGGANLQITYLPTAYGTNSAVINLYGGGLASDVAINLSGTAKDPSVVDGNLLENPSLENWTSGQALPWEFDAGTNTLVTFYQESSIVKDGSRAVKVDNPDAGTTVNIAQSYSNGLSTGDKYELSFDYYVVSGDNSDARIWSGWKSFNGVSYVDIKHDWDELRHGGVGVPDYLPSNFGTWSNYAAETTVPEGAAIFDFRVRTYRGSVVVFDNFSLSKKSSVGINDNVSGTGLNVYVTSGFVNVDLAEAASEDIEVYNILGNRIAKVKAVSGMNRISVPAEQILIVKVGNQVRKVISK